MPDSREITRLLRQMDEGNDMARDRVFVLLQKELYALAVKAMSRERGHHTLQPTALVNEAFLKLAQKGDVKNRIHFMAVAANAIRQVLCDHARRKNAVRHGGGLQQVSLHDRAEHMSSPVDLLALNDELVKLKSLDSRQHTIVELRFFAGLTLEEVAEYLGISISMVRKEQVKAMSWLSARMDAGKSP